MTAKNKLCSVILILILGLCGCGEKTEEPAAAAIGTFTHPHGYSIAAPEDFSQNTALEAIELRLERDDCVIEVFKEELPNEAECDVYSSYSNGFLETDELHILDEQRELEINGRRALLTSWHREKCYEGDRNHYAVTDIYDGSTVYTIVVKADRELSELDFDYMSLGESLELLPVTEPAAEIRFTNEKRSPMNAETEALFEEYFGDNGNFHWGLYYHRQPVDGMDKFEALEEEVGRMDMALLYTEIYDEYDPYMVYGGLVNAWESGKICVVTLQTDIDGDESDVYEVLRGEHDDFLYSYAEDIVRFGHPIFLRPFNEMNGEWCDYSGYRISRDPDLYIRLYKYIYNIFQECGADNVIWVWNPNEVSYPTFQWNREELYYPGDEYVDVVGLSGYNTGTGIAGERWRSFSEIYDGYYERMDSTYNKPLMIAEYGCASEGGDKLQWVEDMFSDLKNKYPKIRAAVWLHERDKDENGNTTRSFFLDDTPGLPELFKSHLDREERI